jgi:hypothetical protein
VLGDSMPCMDGVLRFLHVHFISVLATSRSATSAKKRLAGYDVRLASYDHACVPVFVTCSS